MPGALAQFPGDLPEEPRVLVVEDDVVTRRIVLSALAAAGFAATGVGDGRSALATLERREADLIVLDLGLPGLSGADTLAALRQRWRAPVIVLTAEGSEEALLAALEQGADDYLVKPANVRELVARARAVLRRSEPAAPSRGPDLVDTLTGLPTSMALVTELGRALTRCRPPASKVGVLLIGLDRFSGVNQLHGYRAADEVLAEAAARVVALAPDGAFVARLSGDEFAVLCAETAWEAQAGRVAEDILVGLRRPLHAHGHVVALTASGGIAVGEAGSDPETLLANAGFALRAAKERGGARSEVFDGARRTEATDRLRLEHELRLALGAGDLRLLYQPQVDLLTGRTVAVEALLRWRHPDLGMISPADFLSVAESSGLIVPIGAWTFEEAGRQARAWAVEIPGVTVRVAVNLSGPQLRGDSVVADLMRSLERVRADPTMLSVEVSEATLQEYPDSAVVLDELRTCGVGVEADNVGVGGVTGTWLSGFPLDGIKVDRRLVTALDSGTDGRPDPVAVAVLQAAAQQGDRGRLRVVAEGVETAEQLRALRTLGFTCAQGFHFAAPLLPAAASHHLRHAGSW